jgi:hypothetical protein
MFISKDLEMPTMFNARQQPISNEHFDLLLSQVEKVIANNPDLKTQIAALQEKFKAQAAKVNLVANTQEPLIEEDEVETPAPSTLRNRKNPAVNNIKKPSYTASHDPILTPHVTPKVPSSVNQMIKSYLGHTLGIPLLGLSALSMIPAAAAQSDLVIKSGNPDGAADECSSIDYCLQAILSNVTNNAVVAQVARWVAGTQGYSSYVYNVGYCFDQDTLNNVLQTVIDTTNDWFGQATCSFESSIWQYTQVSGIATHLSADGCQSFQGAMTQAAGGCQNYSSGPLSVGAQVGIVVGAIAACCLCICACAFVKARNRNSYADNNNEMPSVIGMGNNMEMGVTPNMDMSRTPGMDATCDMDIRDNMEMDTQRRYGGM